MLGINGRKMILSTYSTTKILEEKSHIYKAYIGELRMKSGQSQLVKKYRGGC